MNDWVLYVDANNVVHYHTGFSYSVINVRFTYRITPRLNNKDRVDLSPQVYEDFWYHEGAPLGLRRYRPFSIEKNKMGLILVRRSDDLPDQTRSVTNAIVRLTLELDLKELVVNEVVVPREIYQQVASDLGQYSFFVKTELLDTGQQISIHLISNPARYAE